ncbi:conserved protein of unknown function [Tenacibaculum sp. 190524A02b]|uniref:hypothetical protein n=1 Tax=Tenacibaculum vairaonense TaxID=3137860 RepID=UPI0032B12E01
MMAVKRFLNKGVIAFLLLLVIGIGYLAYQNTMDFLYLKNAFDTEKKELELELDNVIHDYQIAINENQDYSIKLGEKLKEVEMLKDTIQRLKTSNYNLLRIYRKKISRLEKENKRLLNKLDSLRVLNLELFNENDSVKQALSKEEILNLTLVKNNEVLEKKVAFAEVIDIDKLVLNAMKKRSSGKLTTTYRARRANAIKVQFDLLENNVIDKGIKPIYVQLLNSKGDVIAGKEEVTLTNGTIITYSDTINADYYNDRLSVTSLIDIIPGSLQTGTYTVKIYVNKVFTKEAIIKLK